VQAPSPEAPETLAADMEHVLSPATGPAPMGVAPALVPAPASVAVPVPGPAPTRAHLPVLAAEVAGCTRCVLSTTRPHTVFARGSATASLVFVGEGPGADEDATGIPFVGRAGQLLDRMIGAMGLDPATDVYICNIVKCRPPGNRRPEPDEMAACIPYLHEQLAIVNPKVIVALGNTAVAALLGAKAGITKVRGSWKLYKGATLVMPTYHPSYLLRPSPQQVEAKRQAWEDLQAVMKELKLPMPPRKA
jgi:uracil-DNA glycosylase family 4